MAKCRIIGDMLYFYCPGCKLSHGITITSKTRSNWQWNGSLDSPTVTPSILCRGVMPITDEEVDIILAGGKIQIRDLTCHTYLTDGKIQFLSDCSHGLAGQTVDVEDLD